jgi:hypothetical protein
MLAPHAAPQALRERIIARNVLGTDASEATLEVLALQQQQLQPLAPDELSDIDSLLPPSRAWASCHRLVDPRAARLLQIDTPPDILCARQLFTVNVRPYMGGAYQVSAVSVRKGVSQ